MMKPSLLINLLIAFSFSNFSCVSNRVKVNFTEYMVVTSVIDGDTFWADDGSENGIKIRLIGVDAPESRNSGRKKITYYGQQSKDFLSKLIDGKTVRLEYDVGKKDHYSRTLAYVFLTDGTFVNAELVKKGYATIMTIPPNVKHAETFLKLERRARKNNRGLWNKKHIGG